MDKRKLVLSLAVILALAGLVQAREYESARVIQLEIAAELPNFEPRDAPQGRITNGEIAAPEDIPYAAGILSQVNTGTRWCGGSLVSPNYVLTTSSCFAMLPSAATVLLGASNMTDVSDIVSATLLIMHIGWNEEENQDDIALLELIRPAAVGATIRPVRLPNWRQLFSPFDGQLGTVSGWGAISQNSPEILPLNDLRSVQTPVISNGICLLSYLGAITETQICVATSLGSPCHGDNGGPLTVRDPDGRTTQIGIFSYISFLGCNSVWPAVFTRVTPYLFWIATNSDVVISEDFEY